MGEGNSALFELELSLPDTLLASQAQRLIGFRKRYERMHQNLRLLIDKAGLEAWSKKYYRKRIALIDSLLDRYPLVVFHGDVGTGKTATAEAAANSLANELGKDAKLSFLIIDEADSLAASRSNNQSHHEDKVAVNTLIQKIDDIRRFSGRVLIILCTNRYDALDAAILRRVAYEEEFRRPDEAE